MKLKLPYATVDTDKAVWRFNRNTLLNPLHDTQQDVLLDLMSDPGIVEANIYEDQD